MNTHQPHEKKICGARTRAGGVCQKPPAPGRQRCRLHGGASLSGIASPSFKHGRYIKTLPPALLENYQQALEDSELLALRDEIALLDARLADMIPRAQAGESGAAWQALQKTLETYLTAGVGEGTTIKALDELIKTGLDDYAAWSEIQATIEHRRRLVESERKRMIEMQQVITSEQAMALLAAVLDVIKTNVTERKTLAAISAAVGQLMARAPGG